MIAEFIAAGLTFACTPTAGWDGDGPIWCVEGPRIRLTGIAAREIDGSCRSNIKKNDLQDAKDRRQINADD